MKVRDLLARIEELRTGVRTWTDDDPRWAEVNVDDLEVDIGISRPNFQGRHTLAENVELLCRSPSEGFVPFLSITGKVAE